MAKKNQDVQFLMKCLYWAAVAAGVCVVLYIGWQIFVTLYGGVS